MLIAACRVGPRYERPAIAVPAEYRGFDADTTEAGSLGDRKWSEVFRDTTLQALIAGALAANYDVRIAAARVLQAQAQLTITRADQFPNVSGEVSATHERLPATSRGGVTLPASSDNLYQLGLNVSWEADFWGKFRSATEAQRANVLGARWAERAVLVSVVSLVAQGYFTLRELDLTLAIAQRTVTARQESLRITRVQEQNGAVSMVDVREAEQLVYTAQATAIDTQRLITQQENAISVLLGHNPGPIARGLPLVDQPEPPEVPPGLPSRLLERRPDIRQAELALVAANAQIGVAKAALYPQITLTTNGGFESSALSTLLSGPGALWSITGDLLQQIYNAGKLKAAVRLTEAQKLELVYTYRQTIQQAFREVSDALTGYQKTRQLREQLTLLVATTQDAARAFPGHSVPGGRRELSRSADESGELFRLRATTRASSPRRARGSRTAVPSTRRRVARVRRRRPSWRRGERRKQSLAVLGADRREDYVTLIATHNTNRHQPTTRGNGLGRATSVAYVAVESSRKILKMAEGPQHSNDCTRDQSVMDAARPAAQIRSGGGGPTRHPTTQLAKPSPAPQIAFMHTRHALAVLALSASPLAAQKSSEIPKAYSAIREADLKHDVTEMAGPSMRGREGGTVDELRASMWLADQYRAIGLKPMGEDGTYFQWFDMTRTRVSIAASRASIDGRAMDLFQNFIPLGVVPAEAKGAVLWVADANDTTANVSGRIVATPLLAPVPSTIRSTSYTFPSRYADAAINGTTAHFARRGAAAIIFVANPAVDSAFRVVSDARVRGVYDVDNAVPRAANGSSHIAPPPALGTGPTPTFLVPASMRETLMRQPECRHHVELSTGERFTTPTGIEQRDPASCAGTRPQVACNEYDALQLTPRCERRALHARGRLCARGR